MRIFVTRWPPSRGSRSRWTTPWTESAKGCASNGTCETRACSRRRGRSSSTSIPIAQTSAREKQKRLPSFRDHPTSQSFGTPPKTGGEWVTAFRGRGGSLDAFLSNPECAEQGRTTPPKRHPSIGRRGVFFCCYLFGNCPRIRRPARGPPTPSKATLGALGSAKAERAAGTACAAS